MRLLSHMKAQMDTHAFMPIHSYIHTSAHMQPIHTACMHTCLSHTYMYAHVNTYIHTYIHAYIDKLLDSYIHTTDSARIVSLEQSVRSISDLFLLLLMVKVIDGPRSVVFDQAENRLHAQKVVYLVLLRILG